MSSAVVLKSWEGQVVDSKFPLLQWLGGSNYSSVFLTERPAAPQLKAAIKLISLTGFNQQLQDPQLALWSQAAKLSHPNLLGIFENGRCQIEGAAYLYVVTEYAEEDLSQILPQRPLSVEEVQQMLPAVAQALAYLHQAGFVHGGLKPANVMAVGDQLKLSADSLRRIGEPAMNVTSAYDAPESARALTPASDVWSLGVLLATVLTQHEPKTQLSANGTVVLSDAIPEPFLGLARRCLQINPQLRPTMHEILGKPAPAATAVTTPMVTRVETAVPAKPPLPNPRIALSQPQPISPSPPRTTSSSIRPSAQESKLWIVAAVVMLLLIVAGIASRERTGNKPDNSPAIRTTETQPAPTQPAPPTAPGVLPPTAIAEQPKPEQTANTPGSVLQRELPEISQSARNTIQGHVRIKIQVAVDASGNVSSAEPVPPIVSQYFAKQARAAALRWKFIPPQSNGQPQPSQWQLRFQFSRSQTQVSSVKN